jgi:hypothetical protein
VNTSSAGERVARFDAPNEFIRERKRVELVADVVLVDVVVDSLNNYRE